MTHDYIEQVENKILLQKMSVQILRAYISSQLFTNCALCKETKLHIKPQDRRTKLMRRAEKGRRQKITTKNHRLHGESLRVLCI